MARITVEELYHGDKYDVMSAACADYFRNGRPECYDEHTWLDLLIVKHTLLAVEKMKQEGDSVVGMFPDESSSLYVEWYVDDNAG